MILVSSGPPGGPLGGLLGRLGGLSGASSWAVLDHLEAIVGRLGGLLGRLGEILRPSWALLWTFGRPGGHLTRLGGHIGAIWSGTTLASHLFRVAGGLGRRPMGESEITQTL